MDKELPLEVDVVVVGGGVVGLSTLYHLLRRGGVSTLLLERNELTSGTTWHSAANVRSLRSNRNLTRMIGYGIELYQDLEAETGYATGWINAGSISLATSRDREEDLRRQSALSRLYGVKTEEISVGEVKDRWPLLNTEGVLSAVWSPEDGRVSPSDLSRAYEKGARMRGGLVYEGVKVEDILREGGKVVGVRTSRGDVRCEKVVLCGGAWSRGLGLKMGVPVPLYGCEHFYLLTKPLRGIEGNLPTLVDNDGGLYVRDDSGGLLVGSFERRGKSLDVERLGDNFAFGLLEEDWDHFGPLMEHALYRFPGLEEAEVKMLLNGPESFTADNHFLLGEVEGIEGLILGCGMNSVGVASSGGVGKVLSELVLDGFAEWDIHENDPKRLYEGMNEESVLSRRVEEVLGRRFAIPYFGYEWETSRDLRRTPLYEAYSSLGGHFTQVYGWERCLYLGHEGEGPFLGFGRGGWHERVGEEVRRVHEDVGIFDLCMYGKLRVEGADACRLLDRVCMSGVDVAVGRLVYTLLLDERGGVVGDVTVFRLSETRYRVVTGAVHVGHDRWWLRRQKRAGEEVEVVDETSDYGLLGLMGPRSGEVLGRLGCDRLRDLGYFCHGVDELGGCEVMGSRLSYVGESGVELLMRWEDVGRVYEALRGEGVGLVGFYAMDSMRIEKGYLSYGHDMDSDDRPWDLGFRVGRGKGVGRGKDFVGRASLEREGFGEGKRSLLVTLVFEDEAAVAWGTEPVLRGSEYVGETHSSGYGYRVGRPLILARLRGGAGVEDGVEVEDGERLEVEVGGVRWGCHVVRGGVYDPGGERVRG